MDEKNLKLEARFLALEMAVADLFKITYHSLRISPEQISEIHQLTRQKMASETFSGTDPVTSDLLSGEIQEAREKILRLIELVMGMK